MTITEAYERYHAQIRGYIFKRVHDSELADDLTQDTFTKALKSWSTIRGETARAWLYRIAHNLMVDYLRRNTLVAWLNLDAAITLTGLDEAAQLAEREHIEATLSALKPNYASVMRLCLASGNLPYATLALQAGITEQSFKMRVSRGRRMFAAAYAAKGA
jgi:RNA polymerase sigma-70 factor (ECF subfamily)